MTTRSTDPMVLFPKDVIFTIFEYLDPKDFANSTLVCRRWHSHLTQEEFLRRLFRAVVQDLQVPSTTPIRDFFRANRIDYAHVNSTVLSWAGRLQWRQKLDLQVYFPFNNAHIKINLYQGFEISNSPNIVKIKKTFIVICNKNAIATENPETANFSNKRVQITTNIQIFKKPQILPQLAGSINSYSAMPISSGPGLSLPIAIDSTGEVIVCATYAAAIVVVLVVAIIFEQIIESNYF